MGQFYKSTYGLEFAALRFGITTVPARRSVIKMSILSEIIEGGYSGRAVRIEQGGDQKEDILYNKDVALGIYLACMASNLRYDAYNIGWGKAIRSRISPMRSGGSSPRRIFKLGRGSTSWEVLPIITASTISRGRARTWDMRHNTLWAPPSKTT